MKLPKLVKTSRQLRHAEILEEEEIVVEDVFRSTFDYPTRRYLT